MSSNRKPPIAEIICGQKVRHDSRKTAERFRRQQLTFTDWNGRDRPPLVVYRCATCGGFHVGNEDPARRVRVPYKRQRNAATNEE